MSAILIGRRNWTRQPTSRVRYDGSFNPRAVFVGGSQNVEGPDGGPWSSLAVGNNSDAQFGIAESQGGVARPIAIFAAFPVVIGGVFSVTAMPAADLVFIAVGDATQGAGGIYARLHTSAGDAICGSGSYAPGVGATVTGPAGKKGTQYAAAFMSLASNDSRLYVNGSVYKSTSNFGTFGANSMGYFSLACLYRGGASALDWSGVGSLSCKIYMAWFARRKFEDSELIDWTANPWSIFPRRRNLANGMTVFNPVWNSSANVVIPEVLR